MPKLNPISPKKLIKIILNLWFKEIRIRWSHHFFSNNKWKTTVVPVHGNEDISAWLLKKIIRDIWLDAESFDKIR